MGAIILNCAEVFFAKFALRLFEEDPVIEELASIEKVIGVKQSRKVLRDGRARKVYLACDADPALTEPIAQTCKEQAVDVDMDYSLSQLGLACGITVGAAVVAVLR